MQHATPRERTGPTRAEAKRAVASAFGSFYRFCGLLEVVGKDGRRVKFVLNRTQRRYVASKSQRDVVLKGRQVGLTTVILALMVYRFLTFPGAKVAVVCQSVKDEKNVRAISDTIEVFFQSLEGLGIKLEFETRTLTEWSLKGKDSKLEIITAGASKLSADKKGRSQKYTHLHCTEVAYYEYAEDTLRALLNALTAPEFGSEAVFECTANGATGPFFEYCESARKGASGYEFHFFPWYVHEEYAVALEAGERVEPKTEHQQLLVAEHGISPEQLKWWQRKVAEVNGDEDHVNQEYPSDPDTCFLVSGRSFFDAKRVAAMLAVATKTAPVRVVEVRTDGVVQMRDAKVLVPAVRIFREPSPAGEYVAVADTSEGTGGSAGCVGVFERRTARHMATIWGQFPPWELARHGVKLARYYNNALFVVERNNHGHTVIRCADVEQGYGKRIFRDRDERFGWMNHEVSRGPALDTFEEAVRAKSFETPDPYMLREMRTFVVNARGRAEHAKGARDDLVLMGAIAYDVLCRVTRGPSRGVTNTDPV